MRTMGRGSNTNTAPIARNAAKVDVEPEAPDHADLDHRVEDEHEEDEDADGDRQAAVAQAESIRALQRSGHQDVRSDAVAGRDARLARQVYRSARVSTDSGTPDGCQSATASQYRNDDSLFSPRPGPYHAGKRRRAVVSQHARPGAPCGTLGLPALLAGRAPRLARHRQRRHRRADRPCGGRHVARSASAQAASCCPTIRRS